MGECLINSEIINKTYLLVLLIVHKEKICHVSSHSTKNAVPGPGVEENTSLLQGGFLRLSEYCSVKLLAKIMDSLLFKERAL